MFFCHGPAEMERYFTIGALTDDDGALSLPNSASRHIRGEGKWHALAHNFTFRVTYIEHSFFPFEPIRTTTVSAAPPHERCCCVAASDGPAEQPYRTATL
jgi:hypothetical protein